MTTDQDKAFINAAITGTGMTKDGKHIPVADIYLPFADCDNCLHKGIVAEVAGSHCYMFKEKPGVRCGQFKRVPQ